MAEGGAEMGYAVITVTQCVADRDLQSRNDWTLAGVYAFPAAEGATPKRALRQFRTRVALRHPGDFELGVTFAESPPARARYVGVGYLPEPSGG